MEYPHAVNIYILKTTINFISKPIFLFVLGVKDDKEDVKNDGFPKNAVLHLSGCPSDLTRELIKEKMEEFDASVAFVDYNKGDTEGWVRLQDEGKALEVRHHIFQLKFFLLLNIYFILLLYLDES